MRNTLGCLSILLVTGAVHAEVMAVDSLEWMTVDTPLIVRGKAVQCQDTKGQDNFIYRDVTINVQEAFKGNPDDKTVKIRLHFRGTEDTGKNWQAGGHSYLFFLHRGKAADDKGLEGHWVLREPYHAVIDMDKPKGVFLANMKYPKNTEEILEIVRQYSLRMPPKEFVRTANVFKPQTGFARLEIEPGSEIFGEVFKGSVCYINVPVEDKHRVAAVAKLKSASYHERVDAIDVLRNFPGAETMNVLTPLLNDPTEAIWRNQKSEVVEITYPVRSAAFEILKSLGADPIPPLTERKPTIQEILDSKKKK